MRMRAIVVGEGGSVKLDDTPKPGPDWRNDDAIRWLIIENAAAAELAGVFDQLQAQGQLISDHIHGEHSNFWREYQGQAIVALPEPTSWMPTRTWFHLVSLPRCLVSVHSSEISSLDGFLRRWWIDRPGPEPSTEDVLLCILEGLASEESEFSRVRYEIEGHADGLRRDDPAFTVEHLEDLMTRSHHMATVFFEMQRLCDNLEFSRARHVEMVTRRDAFRSAGLSLQRQREGVEQIQRRLEELQRQHIMAQQARTEGRVRILTVISAIFLPLTLLSGIYGMNFVNMPELDDQYSYFVVLGGVGVVAATMIFFFVRKGWLK